MVKDLQVRSHRPREKTRRLGSRALVPEEEVRLGFPADATAGSPSRKEVAMLSDKGKELGLRRVVRAQQIFMLH